jgi:uncharacterized protein YbbC (DUF1343 family)
MNSRSRIALLAGGLLLLGWAAGTRQQVPPQAGEASAVRVGIDVLIGEEFSSLRGRRVGLVTNQTGRSSSGQRTIDVLAAAPQVELVALFSPEHGPNGDRSGKVGNTVDPATGLRVFSLYGESRRATPDMLGGLDVLVFDIQDAGVRYYTYATTMAYAMEEAARAGIGFLVLDRPNPLNGIAVEGPVLDHDRVNFEGYFPLPLRHGMTLGELAQLFNQENRIGARLRVVPMEGWRRSTWFDQTGLTWIDPSPNLQDLEGNTFYPAVELLRAGMVSVGRGTEAPFQQFGAPWMKAQEVARYLTSREIPGVEFEPVRFRPTADVHAGRDCEGVRLRLTDRDQLDVGRLGVELLAGLAHLYPAEFELEKTIRLVGSAQTMEQLRRGVDPKEIARSWQAELDTFRKLRAGYLLYD